MGTVHYKCSNTLDIWEGTDGVYFKTGFRTSNITLYHILLAKDLEFLAKI